MQYWVELHNDKVGLVEKARLSGTLFILATCTQEEDQTLPSEPQNLQVLKSAVGVRAQVT